MLSKSATLRRWEENRDDSTEKKRPSFAHAFVRNTGMCSLMAYICKPLADIKMVSFEFSFMNWDNLVNGTEAQFVLRQ